jgi:prevent-host-death family protein
VSTGELRRNLADVLGRACYAGERTVVERGGKPVAAVVPLGDLEELLALDEADRAAALEALEKAASQSRWMTCSCSS